MEEEEERRKQLKAKANQGERGDLGGSADD